MIIFKERLWTCSQGLTNTLLLKFIPIFILHKSWRMHSKKSVLVLQNRDLYFAKRHIFYLLAHNRFWKMIIVSSYIYEDNEKRAMSTRCTKKLFRKIHFQCVTPLFRYHTEKSCGTRNLQLDSFNRHFVSYITCQGLGGGGDTMDNFG